MRFTTERRDEPIRDEAGKRGASLKKISKVKNV
jgi:hypothetical protein